MNINTVAMASWWDLPIARKHSLQRFLEKRKDRYHNYFLLIFILALLNTWGKHYPLYQVCRVVRMRRVITQRRSDSCDCSKLSMVDNAGTNRATIHIYVMMGLYRLFRIIKTRSKLWKIHGFIHGNISLRQISLF